MPALWRREFQFSKHFMDAERRTGQFCWGFSSLFDIANITLWKLYKRCDFNLWRTLLWIRAESSETRGTVCLKKYLYTRGSKCRATARNARYNSLKPWWVYWIACFVQLTLKIFYLLSGKANKRSKLRRWGFFGIFFLEKWLLGMITLEIVAGCRFLSPLIEQLTNCSSSKSIWRASLWSRLSRW